MTARIRISRRSMSRIEMNTDDKYQLLKLYIRNLSVESPWTGRLPNQIVQPNIDIDIDPAITRIADNLYEVAARFTISARANGIQLYLIELTQAGFFSVSPSGEAHQEQLLRRVFPQLIYPEARSNIVSFIVSAGYQPIVLEHIRLDSLFVNTPIVDRRPAVPAPPIAAAQPVPESGLPKIRRRVVVFAGVAVIFLLLALQVDKQRWGWFEAPAVAPIVVTPVAASAIVQSEVLAARQLEQTGSQWLAAQQEGAFTVELLRTPDLKKIGNIVALDQGQPLFLVKLAGDDGYAVLSGIYQSEDQARQAAAISASYRAMRFGAYR